MIGLGQTISQPYMVAAMTALLDVRPTDRVLEIGTGSGYQSAVLALLAREVYTVERHPLLSLRARGLLDGLGLSNLHYLVGDGTLGWPAHGPLRPDPRHRRRPPLCPAPCSTNSSKAA